MNIELKKRIKNHIENLKSANDIFDLFRLLNYPEKNIFDTSYKREKDYFGFKKDDCERINQIYSIMNFDDELPVFLLETTTLTPSFIRSVTTKFDSQYMRFLLIFVVSDDYSDIIFVLPDREKVEAGKYKLKLTKLNVNREDVGDKKEHYTVIETLSNIQYDNEQKWRYLWKKWADAFNVEKVTEAFFDDYKTIFFSLRNKIEKQEISQKDSHEFTLQFLNRIMFIYFISKKGWLQYPKFMNWVWKSYKKLDKYGSDEFCEQWLNQIFFKAFNNRSYEIMNLPDDVNDVISRFPYLNGGLFAENKYDLKGIKITDNLFQRIFEFFEKYNFTIKEDMPFESEVAVDPQMIGYVYESLANVADEIYDRNDLGIFYTPRVEVDFMCRRSLVEYLSKNLPEVPKDKLYHFVFDLPEEKWKTENYFTEEKQWHDLENACDNLSAVDPACGSGAFLVGMLNVLDELYRIIYKHIERDLSDFERKYRIIQYSLYGVDVMPWAIHAAELRLWLQLIIETELRDGELQKSPLLPNLNLNLRIGDSLVQEIGGVNFNVRTNDLDQSVIRKLDDLKNQKRLYYENSRTARFKDLDAFKKEETRLFQEIIKTRINIIHKKIESLERDIKQKQTTLNFDTKQKPEFTDKKREESEKKIKTLKDEENKIEKIKEVLKDPKKRPFIWDIDFAEIFGDKNGFDIVIGNPPYIRQEMISPPNKVKSSVKKEDKEKYKSKLIESVKNKFSTIDKIDMRSDYYIYFYFHGLSLLNENGTFCFITSNSWLDVGYGKNLQEFLLKYIPIIAIYDNPKRSFSHADVNTVISLFGAPTFKEMHGESLKSKENDDFEMLQNVAKFVMFKKPFESVTNATNLIKIEEIETSTGDAIIELVKNVINTNDYRVFPVIQEDLLEDGWKYPKIYNYKSRFQKGSYEGNKWGSKYLRAPDVFYTILNKGKDKLINLEEIAEVKRGYTTGVNDFFYLPNRFFDLKKGNNNYELVPKKNDLPKDLMIENEYLEPVLKSPKECKSIIVEPSDLKFKVFVCNKSKKELKGSGALKYIEWGEKQKFNKIVTVSTRKKWWDLGNKIVSQIAWIKSANNAHLTPTIKTKTLIDQRLYAIIPLKDDSFNVLKIVLNSFLIFLFKEINGRVNLGDGVLDTAVYEISKYLILDPTLVSQKEFNIKIFDTISQRGVVSVYEECGLNPQIPFREQEPKLLPGRADLDNIVFDEVGLTEYERKEVYWSVCELVKQRLDKANSLRED